MTSFHRPLLAASICFALTLLAPRDISMGAMLFGAALIGACVGLWPKAKS